MLTAFRQNGPLPVDVEVHASEPEMPSSEWGDVVEFSLVTLEGFGLAGWDGPVTPISMSVGQEVRGRYAVANADDALLTLVPPFPELYQLRFWPAPLAPTAVVRSETAAGQYWNFQSGANQARSIALELPEGERTRGIIDIAFHDHPETAEKIAGGEVKFTAGIIAYVQKIYPAEYGHDEQDSLVIAAAIDIVAGAK
jgi:hypothetical protein